MLNFVLCDDNASVLYRLSKMLESIFIKHNIDASIILESSNANEVVEFVKNNKFDVLILDINLKSEITGFDIANVVRNVNKNAYIIFSTGHLEYVLMAYKYKTFDYIPKPIVDDRLEETILRLMEDISQSPDKYIKLSNNTIINQNEINYIKKDGMKLIFCTANRNYEIYSSFSKIESCLPDNFIRCHKSYIINVNNIANLTANENTIIFDHNVTCFIGAKYKNKLLEVFKYGTFTNNLECVNK